MSSILYSIIYIIVCSNIFKYSEAVLSLASEASVRSWKMRSSDVWKLRPEASGETTIETSEASQEEAGEVPAICQHPTTVIPYPSISKPEKGDPNISKMTWSNKADPLLVDSVHGNRWDMDMGTVSSCISPKLVCTCLREHIKDWEVCSEVWWRVGLWSHAFFSIWEHQFQQDVSRPQSHCLCCKCF